MTMHRLADNERIIRVLAPIAVAAVMLGIWQALVMALEVPYYVVPSPGRILATLIQEWPLLMGSLFVTLKVTVIAFALAVLIGTCVAFLFVQSRWIEMSFFPYAVLFQVTPIVAIAPLIVIWADEPQTALVICAMIIAVFPIISNTTLGLRSVSPGLMNLFRMNKASRLQVLWRLRIPSALPYFFGGLRISSGLALIGAVVAEFVAGTSGTNAGLAYQILQAGFALDIPLMFAALLMISVTGVLLFLCMVFLTRLALSGWHESEMTQDS